MAEADSIPATTQRAVLTRAQAKAAGDVRYYTGLPCRSGHVSERLVSNGSCLACVAEVRRQRYRADPAADLARQKIARSRPGYAEARRARRQRADPELAGRVEARAQELRLRHEAAEAGQTFYTSLRACRAGHAPLRFSRDGKCVECNRLGCHARASRARFPLAGDSAPAIANLIAALAAISRARKVESQAAETYARRARSRAVMAGELMYVGRPCHRGHGGLRYLGGGCVQCAAIHASSAAKKAYDKLYYEANRDRIRARSSEYAAKTSARRVETSREWSRRNAAKRKVIAQAYKHRRRQAEEGGDPTHEILRWVSSTPKFCHWCGKGCGDQFHVDHYQPLSKGGKHEVKNLVIACAKCNLRKSSKDPYGFANSIGRLF